MPALNGHVSKYDRLAGWLLTLPADRPVVALSLIEIEDLVGAALPSRASSSGYWTGRGYAAAAIRAAGFKAQLDQATHTVTFERSQREHGAPPDGGSVAARREHGGAAALVADRAQCRDGRLACERVRVRHRAARQCLDRRPE